MGRRPRGSSREVFTPTSKRLSEKPPSGFQTRSTTGPSGLRTGFSPEPYEPRAECLPETDEDGQLGAPEDYVWSVAPSG